MNYILLALVAISVILNIIAIFMLVLAKKSDSAQQIQALKQSLDEHSRHMGDEFQRSRLDTVAYQKDMREETSKSLNEMSQKLSEMTKANYEQQINLVEKISRS
ncbi:MAG: hypothetical protein RSD42_04540, partial [Oscillospiraceae bacterium]